MQLLYQQSSLLQHDTRPGYRARLDRAAWIPRLRCQMDIECYSTQAILIKNLTDYTLAKMGLAINAYFPFLTAFFFFLL